MTEPRIICFSWHDPEFGVLLSRNELLQRGWTKATIKKYLGDPDLLGRNPYGGHVQLYSEDRVRKASACRADDGRDRILPLPGQFNLFETESAE